MTAPDEARLRESEERIRRWAFYEYNSEDAVAVKSPLSTFTAGDLRIVLDALSAERERGDRDGWRPISEAPKDTVLLLYGRIGYGANDAHPSGPIRACGYWDEIDSAWAFTDTTWEGPFMEPTHWTTLPEPPL